MGRSFTTRVRVRSYELDILGHVNNAVYLNWLEQARLEAFEALGFPFEALVARRWVAHVVRVEIDFRREVRFGEVLEVHTEVETIGRSSLTLRQRVEKAEDPESPAAEARVVVVWLDGEGSPTPVPDAVRKALGHPRLAESAGGGLGGGA